MACKTALHRLQWTLRSLNRLSMSHGIIRDQPLRTAFTPAGIGMDQFMRMREITAVRVGSSQDSMKKRFVEDVKKSDKQIFSEDLKNLLYLADCDEEIDAVIDGINRYHKSGTGFSNFHFGAPLMRLLCYHDKTDKAISVFTNPDLSKVLNDSASALILMNHLLEKRRPEDAVKIFETAMQRGFVTATGKEIPADVLMLVTEALLVQNTKQAFDKLEQFLRTAKEKDCNLTLRTIGMACLLAIKQESPGLGLEIASYGRNQGAPLFRNLRAMCLADLGRPDEAIQVVKTIFERPSPGVGSNFNMRVYPAVMTHIRKAVERHEDKSLSTKFEELVKYIYNDQLLTNVDIEQYLLTPMNRTYGNSPYGASQQQPGGFQSRMQGGYGDYMSRPMWNRRDSDQYNQYEDSRPRFQRFSGPREGGQFSGPKEAGQFSGPREGGQFSGPREGGQFSGPKEGGQFSGPRERGQYSGPREGGQFSSPREGGQFSGPSFVRPDRQRSDGDRPVFTGKPPLRSPLSGASSSTIRSFSNPTSNRPGPDDENL